jgi:hypothetical protein
MGGRSWRRTKSIVYGHAKSAPADAAPVSDDNRGHGRCVHISGGGTVARTESPMLDFVIQREDSVQLPFAGRYAGLAAAGTLPVMMYPLPNATSRTWTSSVSCSR